MQIHERRRLERVYRALKPRPKIPMACKAKMDEARTEIRAILLMGGFLPQDFTEEDTAR